MSVMGNVSQPKFPGLPAEPYKLRLRWQILFCFLHGDL